MGISKRILGIAERTKEVNRVDIAEVFRSHGIPFYLKIDVEGVDHVVLEALMMFKDRPRYISMESVKIDFDQLRLELDLLRNLGYSKFKIVQQETIPGTKIGPRQSMVGHLSMCSNPMLPDRSEMTYRRPG